MHKILAKYWQNYIIHDHCLPIFLINSILAKTIQRNKKQAHPENGMSDCLQTKTILINVVSLPRWIYLSTVSFYFPETSFPMTVRPSSFTYHVTSAWRLKALSVILLFQTLLFFPKPRFFWHIQRELHCNKLLIQQFSWKQHILERETILCCLELIFASEN